MQNKKSTFIEELRGMKSDDFIYLGVILILIFVVIFIFFHSTNFIVKNINKIFTNNNQQETQTLNKNNYLLAEKKIKIQRSEISQDKSKTLE